MHVQVDVARSENKTSPELKWILARFVLMMSGCAGSFPRHCIVTAKNVQEGAAQQTRRSICLPLAVNQKRERDSAFLAKHLGIVRITQADGRQPGSFLAECSFMVAQLRDVLAAEDSSVVAKKGDHRGVVGPE
jgi:hypothetical protein